MPVRARLLGGPATSVGLLICIAALPATAEKITYEDHIKPIFQNACFSCHNADKMKAGLDLTNFAATMTGSSGGEVLVTESPGDSLLYLVVTHDEEPTMPPKQNKRNRSTNLIFHRWPWGQILLA